MWSDSSYGGSQEQEHPGTEIRSDLLQFKVPPFFKVFETFFAGTWVPPDKFSQHGGFFFLILIKLTCDWCLCLHHHSSGDKHLVDLVNKVNSTNLVKLMAFFNLDDLI